MSRIAFRPLTRADFPLLRQWLQTPEVAAWWGDADTELRLIDEHLDLDVMDCFLILEDGQPVGYLQSYPTGVWEGDLFAAEPPGTRGVDLFLGAPGALGRGLGTRALKAFLARLFAQGVPAVCIDPDPANARAIRAYEKAGFRPFGRVEEGPYAPALLMRCVRPETG